MIHENMANAQELRKDLIQPKKIQKKLIKYFLDCYNQTTQYTYGLGAISREEYLNEK